MLALYVMLNPTNYAPNYAGKMHIGKPPKINIKFHATYLIIHGFL